MPPMPTLRARQCCTFSSRSRVTSSSTSALGDRDRSLVARSSERTYVRETSFAFFALFWSHRVASIKRALGGGGGWLDDLVSSSPDAVFASVATAASNSSGEAASCAGAVRDTAKVSATTNMKRLVMAITRTTRR